MTYYLITYQFLIKGAFVAFNAEIAMTPAAWLAKNKQREPTTVLLFAVEISEYDYKQLVQIL